MSPCARRYTGVFRELGRNVNVVLLATVMVVQLKMPLGGIGKRVLFVMLSGP